jgi:polyisoprenoid-binding protein YceI
MDAERFIIVPSASHVELESRTSLHTVNGRCTGLSGYLDAAWQGDTLSLDPEPHLHLELPVESLRSANAAQDAEMKKFLGSRAHPSITAQLRKIEPLPERDRYSVRGTITVKGMSAEYDGQITLHRSGNRLVVDGVETINIKRLGLEPPKIMMFKVSAFVKAALHLVAEQA